MGRVREFCVEDALSKALEVFWRYGFEGASMTDLTTAMGITRPSLYATYGNKEELFRKALDLYDEIYLGFAREALKAPTSREVATRVLNGFVEVATAETCPRGCMGTNGALACSTAADPIKAELVQRRNAFESVLRKRLERAKVAGDLPPEANPADLARFVMTLSGGIAVQAAGGTTRAALKRVVDVALSVWPETCPVPNERRVAAH